MKNKLLPLLLSFVVAVLCVTFFTVDAFALVFVGTANPSNPGSTSGSGSYGIVGGVEEDRPAGYRFTVVDASGARRAAPFDLYRNTQHYSKDDVQKPIYIQTYKFTNLQTSL